MYKIRPTGGLCNRLRVLFSWIEYSKQNNKELYVSWETDSHCPGYFLDYFEQIEGVTFDSLSRDTIFDYVGCYNKSGIKFNYKQLKPLPRISELVNDKIELLNKNYIAVHIRRTDHINNVKEKMTQDVEFFSFIEKYHHNPNLYIATDNIDTYTEYKTKYNNLVKIPYHDVKLNVLRQTSLQDSIIDLFICVYANEFMGSYYSTFSHIIKVLRDEHKTI
jgi:hypothetical protein